MSQTPTAAQPRQPPARAPRWVRWLVGIVALVAVVVIVGPIALFSIITWQHGQLADEINGANAKEVEPVLGALEAYRAKNGRYPATIQEIHPDFVPRLPRMREHTGLLYVASPAGDRYRLAIAPHYVAAVIFGFDNVREYDPVSRTWTVHDYDDMSPELRQMEGVSRIAGDK